MMVATEARCSVRIRVPADAKPGDTLRLPGGRVYVVNAGEEGSTVPADAFWVPVAAE